MLIQQKTITFDQAFQKLVISGNPHSQVDLVINYRKLYQMLWNRYAKISIEPYTHYLDEAIIEAMKKWIPEKYQTFDSWALIYLTQTIKSLKT